MAQMKLLYPILRDFVRRKERLSYFHLSNEYAVVANKRYNQDEWDEYLGELNGILFKANSKSPAITAIVYNEGTKLPGYRFWEVTDNVPEKPKTEAETRRIYAMIIQDVYGYQWPDKLPPETF